ncbi:MAG TPA: LLM class F420-dependent oxidoreductase [Nitrososphaeraceae archaeon]
MRFGLQHPNFSFDYKNGDTAQIVESLKDLILLAESVGFDSFWVMDHFHQIKFVGNPDEPMLESWTTIATLAGVTTKIKLGTLVTGIVYRHPAILAKIGATLDVLSKGRLFMGIGAAWNQEESFAYGIPFPTTKERLLRLEEVIQIILKMWAKSTATFNGKFYQIKDAYCNPKPIQKPHPPIMIGGGGERNTLRIVAKYADACNLFGSIETIERKLNVLEEHCNNIGRDYHSILKTKLGIVLIDNDKELLNKKVNELFKGMPKEQIREFVIFGTPDEVLREIELFENVGIEYFIVNLDPSSESAQVELFADKIMKKTLAS